MNAGEPLPTVCILAGGLGTRLGHHVRDTPKPLLEVAGAPFLVHQLRLLADHGAREVIVCAGYRGEQIASRIGNQCAGLRVHYSYDSPGLDGTLGAVRRALPLLDDRFLVLYGDTYLRVDYRDVNASWRASGLPAVMTVLHNNGRWDRSNVEFRPPLVARYDKTVRDPAMEWIDYGLGGLVADTLALAPDESDLAALYACLAARGELMGYEATDRFYEIGTPAALQETDAFLRDQGLDR